MNTKRSSKTALKRFLIRYFPPGIIVEYADEFGELQAQTIDLLDLSVSSNPDLLADSIIREVQVIPNSKKPQLLRLIISLTLLFF